MSGPYQGRDLSNCGVGRLHVAINCGVLSVKRKGNYEAFQSVVENISNSDMPSQFPVVMLAPARSCITYPCMGSPSPVAPKLNLE